VWVLSLLHVGQEEVKIKSVTRPSSPSSLIDIQCGIRVSWSSGQRCSLGLHRELGKRFLFRNYQFPLDRCLKPTGRFGECHQCKSPSFHHLERQRKLLGDCMCVEKFRSKNHFCHSVGTKQGCRYPSSPTFGARNRMTSSSLKSRWIHQSAK
jgi:hypothetical protein